MPRAVDPPGIYLAADYDPEGKDLFANPAALPKINLLQLWAEIIDRMIHSLLEFIKNATGGLIDLMPLHEMLEQFWDGVRAQLRPEVLLLRVGLMLQYVIEAVMAALGGPIAMVAKIFETLAINAEMIRDQLIQWVTIDIPTAVNEFVAQVTGFDLATWVDNVQTGIAGAVDQASEALWYWAEFIYRMGVNGITALAEFINQIWTTLQQIGSIFTGQIIANPINNIVTQLNSWWANVGGGLPALGQALNNAITGAGVSLQEGLANAGTQLGAAIAAGQDAITGILEGAGVTIYENMQQAGAQLGAAINAAQDAVWTILDSAGVNINQTLTAASQILGTAINTAQANAQGVIDALQDAAAGVAGTVGAALTTAQQNFANLFNAIPNFLQGLSGSHGQAGVNAALAAQAAANAAAQAQLAAIRNAFADVFNVSPAGGGNLSQTIDFTTMADQPGMAGIMLPGTTTGPGVIGITDGAASYQRGATGSDIQLFPVPTISDYQVIDYTLGPLNNVLSVSNFLYLLFRANAARNTYTALKLQRAAFGTAVQPALVCVVNGTETLLTSGATMIPAAGGTFRIIAGNPTAGAESAFQVLYNGGPIITWTSLVPIFGPGFRYTGLRMDGYFAAQFDYAPPDVRTVSYQDNPPPPANYPYAGLPEPGVKGRVYLPSDVGVLLRDNGAEWERFLGGPLGYFTAPPIAGWVGANPGTSTFVADRDGMLYTLPSTAAITPFSWVRTLIPASNYTAAFHIETNVLPTEAWYAGIILRNAATGALITFYAGYQAAAGANSFIRVQPWSSPNQGLAVFRVLEYRLMPGAVPNWWRIRDDGTNRYYECSHNGVDWLTFYSHSRITHITADQIGLVGINSTGEPLRIRLRSLSGIA